MQNVGNSMLINGGYTLDTCVLFAYFEAELGSEQVHRVFRLKKVNTVSRCV